MLDKHYEGQGFSYRFDKCDKLVSVRLSEKDLDILNNLFPGKNLSFQIRSAIHRCNDAGK